MKMHQNSHWLFSIKAYWKTSPMKVSYGRSKGFHDFSSRDEPIKVIYSKSTCPYENLAFEDYLYEKVEFKTNERLLFLWRNKPSVVIGRHQNPWLEVNLKSANLKKVDICRRHSGGGTVFHDLGNMNLTFFTNRSLYNRKENLEFITKTLSEIYNYDLESNEKDDILLNGRYKVSGSAAKLGLKTAYHHCTLLCDTNLKSISGLLRHTFGEIVTNATKSSPSPTANLLEGKYDFLTLGKMFHQYYMKKYGSATSYSSGFQSVDPLLFPSVPERISKITDWLWVYGKTPKFTIASEITLADGTCCNVRLQIHKGVVIEAEIIDVMTHDIFPLLKDYLKELVGLKFCYEDFQSVLLSDTNDEFRRNLFNQIINWHL